jgi:hypothetical protein
VSSTVARDFRSTPIDGHHQTGPVGPVRAINGSRRLPAAQASFRASMSARNARSSLRATLSTERSIFR